MLGKICIYKFLWRIWSRCFCIENFRECKSQREAMVQPTEAFSSPCPWAVTTEGQFCGSTEAAASQAEPGPNHTLCPCNPCTNHHKSVWDKSTLTVLLQQIKPDISVFLTMTFTGLPPYPSISACPLFKTKGKSVWGLKTWLDGKEKFANFDLNIYPGGPSSC